MLFQSLPESVLWEVFGHVAHQEIGNVLLCCRRFYTIALPYQYSVFNQKNEHCISLLRRIIEQPHLAAYVKHLKGSDTIKTNLLSLSQEHLEWIRTQMRYSTYGDDEDFWSEALSSNWSAVIAILMVLFRNLESIDLHLYKYNDPIKFIKGVLQHPMEPNNDRKPPLHNLHQAFLTGGVPDVRDMESHASYLQLRTLEPFLTLSTVSTVRVFNFVDNNLQLFDDDEPTQIDLAVFNTKDLSLVRSNMDENSMFAFLSAFHSLRRLQYFHTNDLGVGHVLCPRRFKESLSNSKHSLEELILNYYFPAHHDYWHEFDDSEDTLGSLSEFTSLKTLDLDSQMLLGYEEDTREHEGSAWHSDEIRLRYNEAQGRAAVRALPVCLEHLTLRECTPAIFDFVADLTSGDTPPGLKTVKLVFHDDYPMQPYHKDATYWEGEALKKGIVLTRERKALFPDW